MAKTKKTYLKGQFYLAFLTMAIPVFLLMMIVVVDFSNFLNMRSMARSIADSAVLAAAGAVDMGGDTGLSGGTAKGSNYTLNPSWAKKRADDVLAYTLANSKSRYVKNGRMTFSMEITVEGKDATVTVTAIYRPVWSNLIGARPMQTVAIAKASAATGIGGPV
ncbi:MAG: Tad domain-containing protein [Anaerolineaceae bacterium]|nr:Tad domain-containing protein [Anaerolineaceae bacterium]